MRLAGIEFDWKAVAIAGIAASMSVPALAQERWVASWATSQQIPEPRNALDPAQLKDATLRQLVRVSIGGNSFRVRLSNAFGTQPLTLDAVHVALARTPVGAAIDPASDRALTFDGSRAVTIPAGADYWSDPIALPLKPFASVAISIHYPAAPEQQTGHPGSRATSYVVRGDQTAAADLTDPTKVDHWYQIAGIEVVAAADARAIVAYGDSITDGSGSTTNANNRWPDVLAERLQTDPKRRHIAVLNAGIGGNRMLLDGLGPNAIARFDREVLTPPGVRAFILLEGVNDIGSFGLQHAEASREEHEAHVARLISGYRQLVTRARAHGIRAIGATILPFAGSGYYHPTPQTEADRQALNAWIRKPGNFDAMVDFDALTRDPSRPSYLRKEFDSGDGLHPSVAGYQAMAAAIPLAELSR